MRYSKEQRRLTGGTTTSTLHVFRTEVASSHVLFSGPSDWLHA